MTPVQLPLGEQPHHNQQLFSDYYLNQILPQRADWKMLTSAAAVVLQQIRAIWQAYTPSTNEAQTEHAFIRPVLAALGHTFAVQPHGHAEESPLLVGATALRMRWGFLTRPARGLG